jgi:hypothetical protein
MAAGLWLSAGAAGTLANDAAPLTAALAEAGIELLTLNGFPFGDFHRERVKTQVYQPAWDAPVRLSYTLELAHILASCLPAHADCGSISTLPLGYAPDWDAERHDAALQQLCQLAVGLTRLADDTGRAIRVCLEPEPGCVLETTEQAIQLFCEDLPAAGRRQGVPQTVLANHLGICFDVCHQAVQFEDLGDALRRLAKAEIAIGKVQVSSALELEAPADGTDLLVPFAEPRYLHQVRCRRPDGLIAASPDLEEALADPAFPRDGPWRVHFHLPIQHVPTGSGLAHTASTIDQVLAQLAADPIRLPHLEVETYTWQVLPPARRPRDAATLGAGISAELAWLEQRLAAHGLLEADA